MVVRCQLSVTISTTRPTSWRRAVRRRVNARNRPSDVSSALRAARAHPGRIGRAVCQLSGMKPTKTKQRMVKVPAAQRRDAPNDAEIAHPVGMGVGAAAGGAAAGVLIGSLVGPVGTAVAAAAGAIAGAVGGRKLAEKMGDKRTPKRSERQP